MAVIGEQLLCEQKLGLNSSGRLICHGNEEGSGDTFGHIPQKIVVLNEEIR